MEEDYYCKSNAIDELDEMLIHAGGFLSGFIHRLQERVISVEDQLKAQELRLESILREFVAKEKKGEQR